MLDGSRVNIVVPPVAPKSPTITIRKFRQDKMTINELVQVGALTTELGEFLRACVLARLNVIISGGTGSGKTTLLNAMSGFIPEDERIVTIEDPTELRLQQGHVVSLEARPATWRAGARSPSATLSATPCACAPTASSSVRSAAARPST